ncbi:hypothetical protein FJTKL_08218 [Diaporthe vaccinii]|uniref:Uncharacterized protein n=1 Tax=Diaporthe vaccinii TaxID=105482 RepID=A0ABR4ES53_9PEZI
MSTSPVSTFKKLTTKLDAKLEKAMLKMNNRKSADKHWETAANTAKNNEPEQTNKSEQANTVDLFGNKVQRLNQMNNGNIDKQQNKAARRAVRKEKWAARRTAFKRNAKKVGKALIWPVVIVSGVVLAPVYLVAEVVFSVLSMVVMLVVRILDLIFCGPVLACLLCKEW